MYYIHEHEQNLILNVLPQSLYIVHRTFGFFSAPNGDPLVRRRTLLDQQLAQINQPNNTDQRLRIGDIRESLLPNKNRQSRSNL